MRIVYTLTLFLSSALLFLVEPMVAKMILPTFGGAPAVWNASMVFFQAVLLLGYLYTHLTTRWLGARKQAWLHLALMLLPLLVLPIAIPSWAPQGAANPILPLLGLLAVAVGLPFFVLSAGAPLIQKWFADTDDPAASDPYFLYRASNLGSMVGLLGYPVFYERDLAIRQQSLWWAYAYWGLLALMALSAALLWRSPKPKTVQGPAADEQAPPVTARDRLRWTALAAIPSSLLLGVTTYLTSNLSPVPLLWVVPLTLYLLTFVIAFAKKPWLSGAMLSRLLPILVTPMVVVMVLESHQPMVVLSILHLLTFFIATLMCHTMLAESRPHRQHLTEFYLWLSVGGMLGGAFNALLAPIAFKTVAEYPIAIVLACFFRPKRADKPSRPALDIVYALGVAAATLVLILIWRGFRTEIVSGVDYVLSWFTHQNGAFAEKDAPLRIGFCVGLPAVVAFFAVDRPVRFALALGALMSVAHLMHINSPGQVGLTERSFFGVHRVVVNSNGWHQYVHGNTLHGIQNFAPGQQRIPLTYYYPDGPIGQVFRAFTGPEAFKQVGLVGLGIGSLSAYGVPGQEMTFFEIDPTVLWIARDSGLFTFLKDCRAQLRFVLGDARLMLAKEEPKRYQIIVLDAFSSDSIPVHLITQEALAMYLDKLADHGILAFHISNQYLDLTGVLANLAADRGLASLYQDDVDPNAWAAGDQAAGRSPARWLLMARSARDFGKLVDDGRWVVPPKDPGAPLWTDDYSNILSVFRHED